MFQQLGLRLKLIILLASFLGSVQSFAAQTTLADERVFYAEPDIGIAPSFSSRTDLDGIGSASDGGQGFIGGANIGWQIDYVHLILGIRGGIFQSSETAALSYTYQDYGFGLGWEWNVPMMTTLMVVGGSFNARQTGNEDKASGGFGLRFALSYFLSESIKVNATYTTLGFDYDYRGIAASTRFDNALVSVSFPFEVPYPQDWWRTRRIE